ncbi:MAG: hypothetical protein ACT4OS_12580 [Acidimicrobiales bacterium]
MAGSVTPGPPVSGGGPTSLPGVAARVIAFAAVAAAGLCGLLIGSSLAGLGCSSSCDLARGVGGLVGAAMAAGGVAVVSVLVLRAMGEWKAKGG